MIDAIDNALRKLKRYICYTRLDTLFENLKKMRPIDIKSRAQY